MTTTRTRFPADRRTPPGRARAGGWARSVPTHHPARSRTPAWIGRVASEAAGAWRTGPSVGAEGREGGAERREGGTSAPADGEVTGLLVTAVERLVARPIDDLDEPGIDAELAVVETAIRRLDARRCRLAAAAAERHAARAAAAAREAGRDEARAARRARRDTGDRLADTHGWTRGDGQRAVRTGQAYDDPGPAQDAFDQGRLPPRHVRLLADTLRSLTGEVRRDAEARLLEAAAHQDPVTFGRTCRRLLAQLDPQAAQAAENRRHGRRGLRMGPTDDGMLAISGQLSGLDAETVATAVHAFRRPDAPGVHRSAEQATADALVEVCRAALRAGTASTEHGVRPHVTVTIDWQTVLAGAGIAETRWSGPLPYSEVRRLLADCGVGRLLVDSEGVPLEAGAATRSVPAGLWRALQARDRGCIAEGCDVPVGWSDVMHLDAPYRFKGRLSLDNAALGCRHHHRAYDLHGWKLTWHDRRPTLRPPPKR